MTQKHPADISGNKRRVHNGLWMASVALGMAAFAAGYGLAGRSVDAETVVPATTAPETVIPDQVLPLAQGRAAYEYGASPVKGFAGRFLASHFAQSQFDWEASSRFLEQVVRQDPDNADLERRAMLLAIGTGDSVAAARHAQKFLTLEPDNGLSHMVIAVDALTRGAYEDALTALGGMPEGDMTSFAKPLLLGWAQAGLGKLEVAGLAQVPMHLYHGALMSFYAGDKKQARNFVEQIMQIRGLTMGEALRVADMLAALGDNERAQGLLQGLRMQEGIDELSIDRKLAALATDDEALRKAAFAPLTMTRAEQGAALALFDMANILYQEESDTSAMVFVRMALAIDADMVDARILLTQILIRNDRAADAIALLRSVPPDHPSYLVSRRQAAQLMAEDGRRDDAVAMMEMLYADHQDIEALITIGDIYRYDEMYKEALVAYNRAAKAAGEPLPDEYWHLLYARGMMNERLDHWNDAVADLKRAVDLRPNHPYLLNYLGYGWADKGENLDEALELIRRAVALRPMDGYIADSLGWVLYRMGRFNEAVPHLERAVELLPYDTTINDHLGDVYWRVGRRMEARFQWRRAINASEDAEEVAAIEDKLKNGLPAEIPPAAKNPAPPKDDKKSGGNKSGAKTNAAPVEKPPATNDNAPLTPPQIEPGKAPAIIAPPVVDTPAPQDAPVNTPENVPSAAPDQAPATPIVPDEIVPDETGPMNAE